jgi:tetratricopeptide (TPR) repeat protein
MSSEMGIEDDEIQYNLASFLISRGGWEKKLEGLGLVARLALRQEFLQLNPVYLFMDTLTALHESSPSPWRGDNFSVYTKIRDFFNDNNIANVRTKIDPLINAVSRFLKVFTSCPKNIRETPAFPSILDASVQSIINNLGVRKVENGQVILRQNYLSKTDKQGVIFRHIGESLRKEHLLITPYTKGLYASSLMSLGRYPEAKPIYDEILGNYVQEARSQVDSEELENLYSETLDLCLDNPRMVLNYSLGGFCYAQIGKQMQERGDSEKAKDLYRKAKNIYDISLALDSDIGTHLQRTRALVLLGEYPEACDAFKELITYPASQWRSLGIEKSTLYKEYATALQKAGDEEGIADLLMRQQLKVLNKGTRRGQLVRNAVMFQRQEAEREAQQRTERRLQEEIRQQQVMEMRTQEVSSPQTSSSSSSSQEPNLTWSEVRPTRFLPPSYRKKQKTKGTPSVAIVQEETSSSSSSSSSSPTFVNVRTLLKGTPLKIFNKFFESQRSEISDKKIKIYLSEVETLMAALGQRFDPSAGKGSHTKVTIDSTSIHTQLGEADPLMSCIVTLAKHDTLKPYQIKQMREMFEAYGLYPEDLSPAIPR